MPDPAPHPHRLESLAVFATVVRSAALVRVQLAFLLFNVAEVATWIAILVYAYDRGGAAAAGLIAFAQLAPATVFAPIGSALGDRIPRTRMLALAYAVYGLLTLAAGACLVAGLDPILVLGTVILSGTTFVLVRPAHAAVLPSIASTPSELTAANVVSGTVESVGVLAGSIAGGFLLASIGSGGVYVLSGVALLAGWASVAGMRPAAAVTRAARAGARPASPVEPATGDTARPLARELSEIGAGLRAMRADPHVRVVVVVLGLSSLLAGAIDVLAVVLALDVLGIGEEGVGLLNGALGAGGFLGSAVAILLVGRPRLLFPVLGAAIVFGGAVATSGLLPLAAVALAAFAAAGLGRSVLDVAGRTLLQRVAPDAVLARVFGVLEGINMAALALGTLAAPLLVGVVGSTLALVIAGLCVPVAVVLLRDSIEHADRAGVVHERELALIRGVGMFAPLRVMTLERLAAELEPVHVPAGEVVIREGEAGDTFYLVGAGRCEVAVGGRVVNVMIEGDGFGEIALLNDVPRTATVTALGDVDLFALDRGPFLEAVTGQPASRAAARRLVADRLASGG
jgi:MFS family permease